MSKILMFNGTKWISNKVDIYILLTTMYFECKWWQFSKKKDIKNNIASL